MSQNFRSRALASVAAVAIVASGAVGAALYEGQPAFAQTAKAPITVNAQAPATFADVVDQVKPAVVSVRVKVENAIADSDGLPSRLENVPPQLRELCRRFGENGMPGEGRRGFSITASAPPALPRRVSCLVIDNSVRSGQVMRLPRR